MTDATLDAGITVGTGDALNPGVNYCFEVRARNGDNIETIEGTEVCLETTGDFDPPPPVTMTGIGCSGCGIN